MNSEYSPETVVVEAGRPPRDHDAPVNPPVVLTSTYVGTGPMAGEDRGYGRYSQPSWDPLEEVLGTLEHSALPGLLFGSGLAACSAAMQLLEPGGVLVLPRHSYMGTVTQAREMVENGRAGYVEVDIAETGAVIEALDALDGRQGLLWLESPTNPMLEVADLPVLIAAARERGVRTVVDNTFATPLLQRPLTLGADVVVHSVTKYLAGHSDVVLGAAVTSDEALRARLLRHRSTHGAIAGPFEAWLALRGVRTLALRIERSQSSAAELARRAQGHPSVAAVRYPGLPGDPGHARAAAQMDGFGSVLCLELPSAEAADDVTRNVRLWTPATSLGGVESLIERRRRHDSEPATVPEGLLRLSVGIENVEDLWNDLKAALDQAPAGPGSPASEWETGAG